MATDVWIVDSKSDKVFKYAGAASRLSGSQNAASSFSLNSSNRSPKDIVTDGTSLWVVNDSTTDKVFKYTVGWKSARQLDDRLDQFEADRSHDRSDQCQRHLDRRQRDRPRLSVHGRRQSHLRQPNGSGVVCPRGRQHQSAGNRRSAKGGDWAAGPYASGWLVIGSSGPSFQRIGI